MSNQIDKKISKEVKQSSELQPGIQLIVNDVFLEQLLCSVSTPAVVVRVSDREIITTNLHFQELVGREQFQDNQRCNLDLFLKDSVWSKLQESLCEKQYLADHKIALNIPHKQTVECVSSWQLINDEFSLGIIQEVVCQHQLETILQERYDSGFALLEHLPVLVYQASGQTSQRYWVSGNVHTLTGYLTQDPGVRLSSDLIAWVHPDDRAEVQRVHQQALETRDRYQLEYRILTAQSQTKWIQDQGWVTAQGEQPPVLNGMWLDITRYKQSEVENRLLHELIRAIGDIADFDEAILLILQQVCETTGWDLGEVWIPSSDHSRLELLPVWYTTTSSPQLNRFRNRSLGHQFELGVGLPGRVWQLQQPQWFSNTSTSKLFIRAELARDCGIKAGFGIPVLADGEVVAVLVFFMGREQLRDPQLLQLVSTLALELGQSLQRKRRVQEAQTAEIALVESQRQLKSLIDALPGMFFRSRYEPGSPMSYVSEGCFLLTGYAREEFLAGPQRSFDSLIHPNDRLRVQRSIYQALEKQQLYVEEYRIRTKTGQQKWVWEKGHGVYERGQLVSIEGFITDITDRKATEEALAAAEVKYRSIFENALEGIFQTTPDGRYLDANPALARIYGYDSPTDLMHHLTNIEQQLYVDESKRQDFQKLMQRQGVVIGFESQIYRRDRSKIWITESAHAVNDDAGNVLYYEGLVMDITDQKRTEAELHQRAFYDGLTQLPNRSLFSHCLSQALQRSQTETAYEFVVLFLDLDRFKVVNDSLGHLVGDQLLVNVARRLESHIRSQDLVARLGGDEFTILLDGIDDIADAVQIAQQIETGIKIPFQLGEHEIFTSTSIGMVWSKQEPSPRATDSPPSCSYTNIEDLLRDADTALYKAKAQGKGCYQLFSPTMHQGAIEQFTQETELHRALEADELGVCYQPIYVLETGKLYGFEAQLYWQHPTQGRLAAGDFVTLADETHLTVSIYHWLLRTVCQHLQGWSDQLDSLNTLKFHIHCWSDQIFEADWIKTFVQTCQDWAVSPQMIQLEVAGSFLQQNSPHLDQQIQDLTQHNIQLCIHDFGLGVASLQALYQQPICALKLRKSLVQNLDVDSTPRNVLRIMTILAHHLRMDTFAAEISTQSQHYQLQELGCHYVQGPLFGNSLEPKEILNWIQQNNR